jgi:hypothetical protein
MGIWDALRGRRTTSGPNLDALFAVPSAAVTLQASLGLEPAGEGSVCFRAATGAAFRQTQAEVVALLDADPAAPDVEATVDSFGFTWLTARRDAADVAGLCTDLHAINTSLEEQGFGSGLLCSLVPFVRAEGGRVGLVYLYQRGTFYPFAPSAEQRSGEQQRDNLLEIQVRDALDGELPVEQELSRWLAVWGAPGL